MVNKYETGFTLIELLIVVALLGALAVGLLATVDPFEQLKKGNDTARRNTTSEVYNAAIRVYAAKGEFPWTTDVVAMPLSAAAMTAATDGYLSQIIALGELKPQFVELAGAGNLGKIFLTSTADNGFIQNLTVCYMPESKSFQGEANAKFTNDGVTAAGCLATGAGGTGCYWCVK